MQPQIRLAVSNDTDSMAYKSYLPIAKVIEVTISGSDPIQPWAIPAGTYIEKIVALITDSLDAGTLDIGDEDTDDAFIADNEWTETSDNVLAASTQTTMPDGKYYPATKLFQLTPSADVTAGVVKLLIIYWDLLGMEPNQSYP
jgi:hypothetical protein